MPVEPKIIFEAPGCPNPKCNLWKGTVSQLGCEDAKSRGKIALEAFTKLGVEVVPLEQPVMAGVPVQAIAVYYDICSLCGTRYCTRAELLQVPVQMPGQMPPGANFRMPPNGIFGRG